MISYNMKSADLRSSWRTNLTQYKTTRWSPVHSPAIHGATSLFRLSNYSHPFSISNQPQVTIKLAAVSCKAWNVLTSKFSSQWWPLLTADPTQVLHRNDDCVQHLAAVHCKVLEEIASTHLRWLSNQLFSKWKLWRNCHFGISVDVVEWHLQMQLHCKFAMKVPVACTSFDGSLYWIFSVSMARIMEFMAMKIFW